MMEECKFKYDESWCIDVENVEYESYIGCKIMYKDGRNKGECVGENNCPIFQTYKLHSLFLKDYTDRLTQAHDMLKKKGLIKDDILPSD